MRTSSAFNRRFVAHIFLALVIALTLSAFRIQPPTLKADLLPTKLVAYTVVLQEFHLQRDGTALPSVKYTFTIRGDGSRAFETTNTNPANPPSSERILDFSSGKKMYIFTRPDQQLKTTTFDPVRNRAANWLRDPGNNCLISGFPDEKPDGEEVIEGYRTVKLTYDGSLTQWFALDKGCPLIKDRFEWPDGQGMSEKRLVALIPGEPAASMFDDPAGFQEVPPSRWLSPDANLSSQDAYYESHRPPDATARPE